jgi:hypothetical protein
VDGKHRDLAPYVLGFRASNQQRGSGGQRARRTLPRRILISEDHQRPTACQNVYSFPQGRLRSRPFALIKDEAHVTSKEFGEGARGETFRQQTTNGALNRHRQDQRVQEARRVTDRKQGWTFRGYVAGVQQADFSPREREPPTGEPAAKPVAGWNSWTGLHG